MNILLTLRKCFDLTVSQVNESNILNVIQSHKIFLEFFGNQIALQNTSQLFLIRNQETITLVQMDYMNQLRIYVEQKIKTQNRIG